MLVRSNIIFFLSFNLYISSIFSLPIIIHNETDETLYSAIYFYHEDASRATEIKAIEPGKSEKIEQPNFRFKEDRELVFDYDKNLLKDKIEYKNFINMPHINVGIPGHYYIAQKDSRLKAYSLTDWHLLTPVTRKIKAVTTGFVVSQAAKKIIKDQSIVQNNPYKNTQAQVRIGPDVSQDEKNYRLLRLRNIKPALEKLLGQNLDRKYIPEIAIVGSGGGYRAMLYLSGFLKAAEDLNFFDTVLYLVGLSGSTWCMSYLTQAFIDKKISIKETIENLAKVSTKSLTNISPTDFKLILDTLLIKWAFNQPISAVDLFGLILSNRLFESYGDKKQKIYLSNQKKALESGRWPLPIYTAIAGESSEAEKEYYEFNPFEVYSPWKIYVPTWAFGDKFIKGSRNKTYDVFAPEQPLGILLGTFGSAFAASLKMIYKALFAAIKNPLDEAILTQASEPIVDEPDKELKLMKSGKSKPIEESDVISNDILPKASKNQPFIDYANYSTLLSRAILGPIIERTIKEAVQIRLSSIDFLNFTQGVKESPIKNNKYMTLVDAGAGPLGNLPYVPVSGLNGRKPDILILVDASESIDLGEHDLSKLENFARKNNLKFPKLDNVSKVIKSNISIFKDENDPNCPVIIYMPRIQDSKLLEKTKNDPKLGEYYDALKNFSITDCLKKDCSTYSFQYSLKNAKQLQKLAEFNFKSSFNKIKDEIERVINKKSKK